MKGDSSNPVIPDELKTNAIAVTAVVARVEPEYVPRETPMLRTVNKLALDIEELKKNLSDEVTRLATQHGVSLAISINEDTMKLGLYRTSIHITNINGVHLG